MKTLLSLVRPNILKLQPYESARSLNQEGSIFLDANESPTSPIQDLPIHRYPEPQPRLLLERFSQIYGAPAKSILVCRGSDEGIDLLCRVFCEPSQDQILICPPTYGMYEVCASIQGAEVLKVPLLSDSTNFYLDVEGIRRSLSQTTSVKIIFICSPNNPTGTQFSLNSLEQICEMSREKCILVIDEAYLDFNENKSLIERLNGFPHLVILRTLSKAWALAGARCGVVIASEAIIQLLNKVRPPYPLSTPTIDAVLKATDSDHQNLFQQRIQEVRINRNWLETELRKMESVVQIYPSEANFLLVKFNKSKNIFNFLKLKGLILRDRSQENGLEGCVRVTLGSPIENQALITTLQEATCGI